MTAPTPGAVIQGKSMNFLLQMRILLTFIFTTRVSQATLATNEFQSRFQAVGETLTVIIVIKGSGKVGKLIHPIKYPMTIIGGRDQVGIAETSRRTWSWRSTLHRQTLKMPMAVPTQARSASAE